MEPPLLQWNIVSVNTFSSKPQDKHQAAWNYFGQLLIWPISKHMLFSKWPRASSSLGTYIWIMMDLLHSYLIQELILDATFSRHWTVCDFLIFKSGLQFIIGLAICLFLKWPSMDMWQQRQLKSVQLKKIQLFEMVILLPFLVILLPTALISFTKRRFWWSFWDA